MKQMKHEATVERLEGCGWVFDHTAICRGYHLAGTTEPMKSRNGSQYIRVYTGFTVRQGRWQTSYVYRREA